MVKTVITSAARPASARRSARIDLPPAPSPAPVAPAVVTHAVDYRWARLRAWGARLTCALTYGAAVAFAAGALIAALDLYHTHRIYAGRAPGLYRLAELLGAELARLPRLT